MEEMMEEKIEETTVEETAEQEAVTMDDLSEELEASYKAAEEEHTRSEERRVGKECM